MLISRLAVMSSTLLLVLAVHAVLQRPCKLYVPPEERVDQGCIHQGNDRRLAAPVVCWLQRRCRGSRSTNRYCLPGASSAGDLWRWHGPHMWYTTRRMAMVIGGCFAPAFATTENGAATFFLPRLANA
jgi:hypothetical protein